MTSGDIKTIILAIASAVLGAGIVLKYRSYVMARFSVYRHVWEADYYNSKRLPADKERLWALPRADFSVLGIGKWIYTHCVCVHHGPYFRSYL